MELMRLCLCFIGIVLGSLQGAEVHPGQLLRGKLAIHPGHPATLETAEHQTVQLDGDETALKVLQDKRLDGFQVEARGHFTAADRFRIDPSYTHSLLVRKDGKLKLITYWCDLCSIRAYTPGPCVCCQRETTLDLQDPDSH